MDEQQNHSQTDKKRMAFAEVFEAFYHGATCSCWKPCSPGCAKGVVNPAEATGQYGQHRQAECIGCGLTKMRNFDILTNLNLTVSVTVLKVICRFPTNRQLGASALSERTHGWRSRCAGPSRCVVVLGLVCGVGSSTRLWFRFLMKQKAEPQTKCCVTLYPEISRSCQASHLCSKDSMRTWTAFFSVSKPVSGCLRRS